MQTIGANSEHIHSTIERFLTLRSCRSPTKQSCNLCTCITKIV